MIKSTVEIGLLDGEIQLDVINTDKQVDALSDVFYLYIYRYNS